MPSRLMQDDPLHDWEQWGLPFNQPPTLVRELGHGLTNRSYIIEADQQLWVLRRNNKNAFKLGINRQHEATIYEQAAMADIAPTLLYCSVENGVLINKFIDGCHWQDEGPLNEEKQHRLIELLREVHSLEVDLSPFDYAQHLDQYWTQLQDGELEIQDNLYKEYEALSKELKKYLYPRVLCHHDPSPQNIIEADNRLYLIDWEYAGMGWSIFDYAALMCEWGELPVVSESLPDEVTEQLGPMKMLYNHLCDVWDLLRHDDAI